MWMNFLPVSTTLLWLSFYNSKVISFTPDSRSSLHSFNSTVSISNATGLHIEPNAHCTDESSWLARRQRPPSQYLQPCLTASLKMLRDLRNHGTYVEYEFLSPGIQPLTTLPQIRLPLRYTARKFISFNYSSFSDGGLPGNHNYMETS